MKNRSDVDMSDEAIARRLEELGALYRLGMSLLGARRIGRIEPREAEQPRSEEPVPADDEEPPPRR